MRFGPKIWPLQLQFYSGLKSPGMLTKKAVLGFSGENKKQGEPEGSPKNLGGKVTKIIIIKLTMMMMLINMMVMVLIDMMINMMILMINMMMMVRMMRRVVRFVP